VSAATGETVAVPDGQGVVDTTVSRRVLTSRNSFAGRVWSVRSDVVDLGDGQTVQRDVIVHPGAVGVVAVDEALRVLLVQQYRHPVGALLWEPPAGLRDVDGEDARDTAARELFEEAGYRAGEWSVLVDAFTSPGGSDEAVRIYLARRLRAVDDGERFVGDGEERDMPIRWVPLAEARNDVLSGRLHNPLAVMGILAAAAVLVDGNRGTRPVAAPWFGSDRRGG
jgi:ADP-ribose pyrophosphatase